ncbi:MAG: DUF4349 domain-containing protein [Spirochaetales bacterium]|nr:DUF4349 domain-containing protein [Leptospiraceae bacterium]MCP5483122.1 DUF4349 domain-containing protein [Spirochaetales bacterium]MCP5484562.1 DUF4349 domain-containing protein [Spirochaetales bacterium]
MTQRSMLFFLSFLLACSSYEGARTESVRSMEAAEADDGVALSADQGGRRLIRTAWLSIAVVGEEGQATALRRARELAVRLEGYVQSETLSHVTLKVPTERFEEAVSAIEGLGRVESRNISVDDVTERYTDLEIRIRNARQLQERLRALLNQTDDIERILEIETQLERTTVRLEQLEARFRSLDRQVSYSTIEASFSLESRPGPVGWVFYYAYAAVRWLFIWD